MEWIEWMVTKKKILNRAYIPNNNKKRPGWYIIHFWQHLCQIKHSVVMFRRFVCLFCLLYNTNSFRVEFVLICLVFFCCLLVTGSLVVFYIFKIPNINHRRPSVFFFVSFFNPKRYVQQKVNWLFIIKKKKNYVNSNQKLNSFNFWITWLNRCDFFFFFLKYLWRTISYLHNFWIFHLKTVADEFD